MAKKDKENDNQSGGKGKFLIIILLVIIMAGGGAFAGFYFFMQSKHGNEKPIEEVTFVVSKETKVNLSTDDDSKSSRGSYLLTGISVSYDKSNSKLGKEIESKKIQLQDTAIWYLKSKKKEDFTASNRDVLKKELTEALNKKLNEGKLVDVYYSTGEDAADFMVQ